MLHPRTVLITGASSGIGAALAIAYARDDITLILIGRNVPRLTEVAVSCRARGAHVVTVNLDVRERAKFAEFLNTIDTKCPIDLVIANAGIASDDADDVFAVNVNGVLNTIHPLIARMKARGRGQIAIMSSLAGIRALPSAPAYSASKAAVRFYGDALRGELAPYGIGVSVICPGWVTTPLTEKNDFPMPFILSTDRAVLIIKRGLEQKKSRIAFPFRLYFLLNFLAMLPLFVSDPFFARLPKKRLKR